MVKRRWMKGLKSCVNLGGWLVEKELKMKLRGKYMLEKDGYGNFGDGMGGGLRMDGREGVGVKDEM